MAQLRIKARDLPVSSWQVQGVGEFGLNTGGPGWTGTSDLCVISLSEQQIQDGPQNAGQGSLDLNEQLL